MQTNSLHAPGGEPMGAAQQGPLQPQAEAHGNAMTASRFGASGVGQVCNHAGHMFGHGANSTYPPGTKRPNRPGRHTGMRPPSMMGERFKPRTTVVSMAQGTQQFRPDSFRGSFTGVTNISDASIIDNRKECLPHEKIFRQTAPRTAWSSDA
jgi:hypothetical protein